MLLRSKTPAEPKGRSIKMRDGTEYQFKPDETGDNVCEVSNEDHVAHLIGNIPEGYEPKDETLRAKIAQAQAEKARAEQVAQDADPFKGEPKMVDVSNEQVPPDAKPGEVQRSGKDYNGLTRKELEVAYEEKFGKPPHPQMKDSTMLERLTDPGE